MKTMKFIIAAFLSSCIFMQVFAQELPPVSMQYTCPVMEEGLSGWHFSGGSFQRCECIGTHCNSCIGSDSPNHCCDGITCLNNNPIPQNSCGWPNLPNNTVFRNVSGSSVFNDPMFSKDKLFEYITDQSALDELHPCISQVKPGSNASVRLGSTQFNGPQNEPSNLAQVYFDFVVDPNKPFYEYSYALVLGDNPTINGFKQHPHGGKAFFDVRVYDITNISEQDLPLVYDKNVVNQNEILCGSSLYTARDNKEGFIEIKSFADQRCGEHDLLSDVFIKDWSSNLIDLRGKVGQKVRVVFTVTGCAYGGHYGYAYLDASCINNYIKPSTYCLNEPSEIEFIAEGVFKSETYTWSYASEVISTKPKANYVFNSTGEKNIELTLQLNETVPEACRTLNFSQVINVVNCEKCQDCDVKFSLTPGDRYVIGAWVQEGVAQPYNSYTFNAPEIKLTFKDNQGNVILSYSFFATGNVVDGWQRIEKDFIVPIGSQNLDIEFVNNNASYPVYFDDFRIHPFNSSMVTYVYNQETMQLEAQLDENNFYTKYIYDEEGNLVKTTVETIEGTRTAAETRSNIKR